MMHPSLCFERKVLCRSIALSPRTPDETRRKPPRLAALGLSATPLLPEPPDSTPKPPRAKEAIRRGWMIRSFSH